jgi:hypothetical protein
MMNAVFWDFILCDSCEIRHFEGILLVTDNVSSSLILFTLMMEVISSSETSVLIRTIQCHISEDGILLST